MVAFIKYKNCISKRNISMLTNSNNIYKRSIIRKIENEK